MAIARRLGQNRRILIVDANLPAADRGCASLVEEGYDATFMRCDMTSAADIDQLRLQVDANGGMSALVIVAGLSPVYGDFDRIVSVNLQGPALVCQALQSNAKPGSAAILIASMAPHLTGLPDAEVEQVLSNPTAPELSANLRRALGPTNATPQMGYVWSKYGLLMLARSQAAAWGQRGARIVTLSPGMIATPMGDAEFARSEGKRQMFVLSPLSRQGSMLEIADAVEFLASNRASFISGTDLLVDGGLSATIRERQ